jgi:hypothetical protein
VRIVTHGQDLSKKMKPSVAEMVRATGAIIGKHGKIGLQKTKLAVLRWKQQKYLVNGAVIPHRSRNSGEGGASRWRE